MNNRHRWVQFGLRSLLIATLMVALSFSAYRRYHGAMVVAHMQAFDGLQDVIVVADHEKLDLEGDFTIEAYVRLPKRQSSWQCS